MPTATTDPLVGKVLKAAHQVFDGTNPSAAMLLSDGALIRTQASPTVRIKDALDVASQIHNNGKATPATRDVVVVVRPDASAAGFTVSGYGTKVPEKAFV